MRRGEVRGGAGVLARGYEFGALMARPNPVHCGDGTVGEVGGGGVQVEFDPFGRGSDTWGGEAGGGGPQGHPGGDLGLFERPGHAEPPPKKRPSSSPVQKSRSAAILVFPVHGKNNEVSVFALI